MFSNNKMVNGKSSDYLPLPTLTVAYIKNNTFFITMLLQRHLKALVFFFQRVYLNSTRLN